MYQMYSFYHAFGNGCAAILPTKAECLISELSNGQSGIYNTDDTMVCGGVNPTRMSRVRLAAPAERWGGFGTCVQRQPYGQPLSLGRNSRTGQGPLHVLGAAPRGTQTLGSIRTRIGP